MALKLETDVLVVGAGPVGLFAALSASERGLSVQVIDKEWRGATHSYALALHPATLRLLAEHDLADDLLRQGHRVERIAFYEGAERAGEIDFAALGGRHPFVLVVPQSAVEQALAERLKRAKTKVFWTHQCLAMSQLDRRVHARVARMDKYSMGYPIAHTEWMVAKEYDVQSRFLIGADGYHSAVRKNLGVRYEHRGDADAFSVYEFACETPFRNEARVVVQDGRLSVAWPLHERRCRFSFQVDRERPAPPTVEGLMELIRARAPWFTAEVGELLWTATVVFERRLVDAFGRDRVWLAGDAAHITGPVGAQSMNVGMREVHDLVARIADVLASGATPETLDVYERERQAEWALLLGGESAVRMTDGAPAWARRLGARIVPCVPASGADLERILGGIGLTLGERVARA
jgi:2-polyprenyl-6-methoxyphenol hydroxylase-like FAD-dependent oxidoreductase